MKTARPPRHRELRELARVWGIQTSFTDATGARRTASPEALVGTLRALGAPIDARDDVADALRQWRERRGRPGIAPVHVAWNGEMPPLDARLPADRELRARMSVEEGSTREWRVTPRRTRGGSRAGWRIGLDDTLPPGRHQLELRAGASTFTTHVISAPGLAFLPAAPPAWGVFLPLYAVRSAEDYGVGDLGDLDTIAHWTASLGGSFVGTLPLLPASLREPFEPSPYAPVTRLFWADLFIDVDRLPGATGAPRLTAAQRAQLARCRADELVDYRRAGSLKRALVNAAAQQFFDQGNERDPSFREFLRRHPDARDYARFRAVGDRRAESWLAWPARLRDGRLRSGDYDDADVRYHLFAAWLAEEQLARVADAPHTAGLYLDLPLGVSRDGYDPWKRRHLFAMDASAGAPPDPFFARGQDWGFPPLHPAAMRHDGHAYLTDCLRHHFRCADALRLDHVMSLQRLYWIPRGLPADQGVYVRYPLDELFAILTLESSRHRSMVIGEDLGTVSREIRSAMKRHGVQRMFVVQFEALPDRAPPMAAVPEPVIASLNTHDMPTFAAFWDALDVEDRAELGLLDEPDVEVESAARARLRAQLARQLRMRGARRSAAPADIALRAILDHLASSPARVVLVNLEDLWLETRPQNVPGTSDQRPNWRHRARYPLERILRDQRVLATLRRIAELRISRAAHD